MKVRAQKAGAQKSLRLSRQLYEDAHCSRLHTVRQEGRKRHSPSGEARCVLPYEPCAQQHPSRYIREDGRHAVLHPKDMETYRAHKKASSRQHL